MAFLKKELIITVGELIEANEEKGFVVEINDGKIVNAYYE